MCSEDFSTYPQTGYMVINSHHKQPMKICSWNRNFETYNLLEKHQTTFTMLWSETCVIMLCIPQVGSKKSFWVGSIFKPLQETRSKKSRLKFYFSSSQVSYSISVIRRLKLLHLCIAFYCFSLLLLILSIILCF